MSMMYGTAHTSQSLPRMLTLWFDFGTFRQAFRGMKPVSESGMHMWAAGRAVRCMGCWLGSATRICHAYVRWFIVLLVTAPLLVLCCRQSCQGCCLRTAAGVLLAAQRSAARYIQS
jgi:hypothetical protein